MFKRARPAADRVTNREHWKRNISVGLLSLVVSLPALTGCVGETSPLDGDANETTLLTGDVVEVSDDATKIEYTKWSDNGRMIVRVGTECDRRSSTQEEGKTFAYVPGTAGGEIKPPKGVCRGGKVAKNFVDDPDSFAEIMNQ